MSEFSVAQPVFSEGRGFQLSLLINQQFRVNL